MNDRILFIVAFIILASAQLSAQWVVKHIGEEGAWIYDLEMHPQGHGLAVGGGGLILRTDDQGESWFPIASSITDEINEVAFVSADTVLITSQKVQKNGTIHRSTDGGFSWEQVYNYPDFFLSLQFFNDSVGLASGINIILRTTDAGATWVPVYDIPNMTGFKTGIIWMDIASDSIAYAGIQAWENGLNNLSRFLLKSVNSGKTWQKVIDFEDKFSNSDIFFHNELLGFSEIGNSFQRTHDGGITWEKTDNIQSVQGISMPSDSIVYSINEEIPVGEYPGGFAICRSLDSGLTWQGAFQPGAALKAIQFLNDSVGFVAGRHALIMKTEHGGGEIIGDYPWELYTGITSHTNGEVDFRCFPNPANTEVSISLPQEYPDHDLMVSLLSSYGQVLQKQPYLHPGIRFDTSKLPTGIYYVTVKQKDTLKGVKKLVIK